MNQVSQEVKIEKFEAFYGWLKADGLTPRKSERLHKKRIFQNLLNNQEMTIENFKDFLNESNQNNIAEKEEEKNYEKYRYKKIHTQNGIKEISFVKQSGEQLEIYFIDKGHALVQSEEVLKKAML